MLQSNQESTEANQAATTGPDILLIGHVTCDLIHPDPQSVQGEDAFQAGGLSKDAYHVGGTVSFAAVTAMRLGRKPTVITRAAPTTDLSELPPGIDLHVLPSPKTTTFANVYTPQGRVQYSYSQALPITADDILPQWRQPNAVLLGPLVNEIGPDVAEIFHEPSLVVAVPQGWMRRWDETGRVFAKSWENAAEILPHVDVLVLSLEDIAYELDRLEPFFEHLSMIVLTEYRDGSTLYQRNQDGSRTETKIPPRPANEVDPTGAGDIFATAFMIRLQETGDPIQSARFANVTASFGVEQVGVAGIPTRAQVLDYMQAHPF